MIRKSLSSTNRPFLLKPAGKDYLWGGTRLRTEFGKQFDSEPLAETWECSTHPDGTSTIAAGEFEGLLLSDVLKAHPEYLGTHPTDHQMAPGQLPILIKFIDAQKDLSVQVHPDDEYARIHEHGQMGKTEMWYVLDAVEDAKLIYGFYRDMDQETLRRSIENGTVEKYLQKVRIQKDDVFMIEAGTVHAIGAGSLIAEIQESSNLTYRLFDYNRRDKNGNLRELHIDKAVAVANRKGSSEPRQPMRVLKYRRGAASELLCRCKYFQVERYLLNTQSSFAVSFSTDEKSFQVFLCLEGYGEMAMDGDILKFSRGDCVFVPAESVELQLRGRAQLLKVEC